MKNYCDLSSPPFMDVNFKIQDLTPSFLAHAENTLHNLRMIYGD
jgi:hypothetical protein